MSLLVLRIPDRNRRQVQKSETSWTSQKLFDLKKRKSLDGLTRPKFLTRKCLFNYFSPYVMDFSQEIILSVFDARCIFQMGLCVCPSARLSVTLPLQICKMQKILGKKYTQSQRKTYLHFERPNGYVFENLGHSLSTRDFYLFVR